MAVYTPTLPAAVRALNTAFALTGPLGKQLISLRPEKLMASAARETGLDDFGSDYFRQPLERLCRSLEQDADLTALGRSIARQDILRLLGNRLRFVDIFKRHPEIAEQEVKAPIFILGMPRTGTTSLHELMALDPQFRVPLSWETAHPFPPPEAATYRSDPRILEVNNELAKVDRLVPNFRHMHPMGAELPQECVVLFAYDFMSMIFDVQFRVDEYQGWLVQEDMAEVFRNHRRWLQLLQWKCPGDTWVLKSPQYLWNIDDMLRQYPDARVVQTHRDPVKVAMSIGSLVTTMRSLTSRSQDLGQTTKAYADLLHYGTERTMSARERGLLGQDRVIDVQFEEFLRGPVAALGQVYEHFGLSLQEPVAQRMQRFLDSGKESERHGKHHYKLTESGLDLAAERVRFASYQQAYDIPSEVQ
jgi:sulfotransferase family protein